MALYQYHHNICMERLVTERYYPGLISCRLPNTAFVVGIKPAPLVCLDYHYQVENSIVIIIISLNNNYGTPATVKQVPRPTLIFQERQSQASTRRSLRLWCRIRLYYDENAESRYNEVGAGDDEGPGDDERISGTLCNTSAPSVWAII